MSSAPPSPRLLASPPTAVDMGLWWLPMVLGLLFVAVVAAWLQHDDQIEQENLQTTLITDSLSLESTLRTVVLTEQARLDQMAADLGRLRPGQEFPHLQENEQLLQALRRGWVSVTWLGPDHRVVQEAPEAATVAAADRTHGQSIHLHARINDGQGQARGELIARLQAGELLRKYVPWWLARRYEVRMVDALDQEISGAADQPQGLPQGLSHRISFDPPLPGISLELTARDKVKRWHQRLPVLLIVGFLVLITWASLALRRQMQRAVQASEAWRTEAGWRRAMEDSMQVGLRARDLDGTLLYVNRTFEHLVGRPAETLVGTGVPYPYWLPDDIEGAMIRHRRNLAGGAPPDGYEATWLRADGREVRVMVLDAPLIDAAGHHVGWMGSVLDITERRAAEERERRQFEQLAHHARLTTFGEIASTLAHELNQPLTVISSYSAGLQNALKARGLTDADILAALQTLGDHAAQAGRIVARIREFLSRHEPRDEPVVLEDVARQAGELLAQELRKRGIETLLRVEPGLRPVRGDPVLLEQVLVNLIRNAADAMNDSERRRLDISLQSAGKSEARIEVRDSGPGLKGLTIRELCQPFFSTKREGMGLGLAICRSLIESHKGEFDAVDMPEGGACFSVTLPCWEE
ncbi:MAG TPA: ATP-binding protein [Burkholderiaceae bacterium]|jgi:two-component system sensor histidine kinase DctS